MQVTMKTDTITANGVDIPLQTWGTGPGLVVVHGAGVEMYEYRRLARNLADRFTVHLYNRRGRPGAAPMDSSYTIDTDIDDLTAVLAHTGAVNVFGHSGGGFVALRAGLTWPIERIAVYDPGLVVDGRPAYAFIDEFEALVKAGDTPRALAVMNRAVHPQDPGNKLPLGLQMAVSKLFLRTPIGKRMSALLPTTPQEIREIALSDGPASQYAGIDAEVLLTAGARCAPYFAENCRAVAAAIPHGRAYVIPRMSHNAANIGNKDFTAVFAEFFLQPTGRRSPAAP